MPGTDRGQPPRPTAAAAIDTVVVVGDSLTVGVTGLVEPLLASLHVPVTVDGANGRRTAAGIAAVTALPLTAQSVVVVALGTNDPPDRAAFAALIDEMTVAAHGARIIWLTIDRDGYGPLNDALYAAAQRAPGTFTVADWATYRQAHPAWTAGDGIHYTHDGYVARAEFIADILLTSDR